MKRIALAILVPILTILLFAIAFSYGLNRSVGSPDKVKNILDKSGVYNGLIPNLLANAKDKSDGKVEVSLDDPAVRAAAEQAFSADFVKKSAEDVIDGTFAWLNGEAPVPNFKVDLSTAKDNFAEAAASAAAARADGLPTCKTVSASTSFDAFSATCLPAGVSPETVAAMVRNDIQSNPDFLSQTTIDADSLKGEDSKQSVFEQMKDAPRIYQHAKRLPLYLAVLALLTGVGIVFLNATRRRGVRQVGIVIATVGLIMLVLSWLVGSFVTSRIKFEDNVIAAELKSLVHDLASSIANNYRLFGFVYVTLGVLAVVATIFIHRPPKTAAVSGSDTPPPTDKITDSSSRTKSSTKPAAKKIQ